jgi:hypothetical protein
MAKARGIVKRKMRQDGIDSAGSRRYGLTSQRFLTGILGKSDY